MFCGGNGGNGGDGVDGGNGGDGVNCVTSRLKSGGICVKPQNQG